MTMIPTNLRDRLIPSLMTDLHSTLETFVMIVRIDLKGIIRDVNDLFCQTSGYSKCDLIGKPHTILQNDFHNGEFYASLREAITQNNFWRGQLRQQRRDRTFYWLDCTITPLHDHSGRPREFIVLSFDITKQKETEERFALAQKTVRMGTWTFTFDDKKIHWTDQVYDIFGFNPTEGSPTLEQILARINPEDRKAVDSNIDRCKTVGTPYNSRYRIQKGNQIAWIESHGHPLYDESGRISGIFGVCQDVSRYAKLESDLQTAKSSLQATLDHMPAVIYSKAPDGRFLLANTKFYEAVPYTTDVIGKYSHHFMPEETATEHMANDAEVLRTGQTIHVVESVRQPDGSIRYYDSYKFPIRSENGEIIAVNGISLDITDRKRAQEELDQQRTLAHHQLRLASIGELAAGVGHEINNPLTIVMSYLHQLEELLQSQYPDSNHPLEMISKALKASERIRNIVGGLRTFARLGDENDQLFPLVRAIENSVNLVKGIFAKEGIDILVSKDETAPSVYGDEGKIQQVLMNLLSNARDAVAQSPVKQIQIRLTTENDQPVIVVSDSGEGILAEAKARIFDPFFTTKPVLKGTGLGLSIALSIMRDHGGEIRCESIPSGGTEFRLIFPHFNATSDQPLTRSEESSQNPTPMSTPEKKSVHPHRANRILVADDEEDIVEILSLILQSMGFEVEGARDGQEAFDKLNTTPFDALITDMNMPRIKGDQLIRMVREDLALSQLKIFVITGGINLNLNDQDSTLKKLIDGYFYKPFDQTSLKTTLFSALGL